MGLEQRLDQYRLPASWHPGAPWLIQFLWFCFGAPLLSSRWLPGSAWRVWLLCAFGAHIGSGCCIKPGFRVKFPWRLRVGKSCWLAEDAWLDNLAPITLGDRVCLSQGVYLCTGNHNFRSSSFDLVVGSINIGADAWIAARAVLAPGTDIGPGAVVALGALVSGSIQAGVIVRGNPAVVVGKR